MRRHTALSAIFLAVALLICTSETRGQDCSFPPKELTQGRSREFRGPYENKAYGYSVEIPADLVGYDSANPFYQNGLGIIIGGEPKSYIVVDGEKNSLEFTGPADAATRFLEYLRKHASKVESSRITASQLGPLKAAFLVATYTCPGSAERYAKASMIAISPDKSNLYEITLFARSDHFDHDRVVLDALVKSWKYLGQ
jgi:hypothetical protein